MKNTLFDDKEKDKRKYTCFCCGVAFLEYEKYKQHIFDKHEEGRDYIKCPLQHCGCPVRDVRGHIKIFHPGTEIPKIGEMRCTIWKDFNEKKSKTRKPKFREGYYDSTKMGKQLHYRSGYEAKIYEHFREKMYMVFFPKDKKIMYGYHYQNQISFYTLFKISN